MKRRSKKIARHNYLRKIAFLQRAGAIPRSAGVHQVDVFHDHSCSIFVGAHCNCDPHVSLQWSQTAAAQN